MLAYHLTTSDHFQDLFMKTIGRSNGVISIIFFGDEATPGQAMAKVNKRKSLGLYWSIAEFGFPLLSNDKLWFTVAAVESHTIKKISGGTSCLYKVCLKLFLLTTWGVGP